MWALSKHDRTTYDLVSFQHTKVTITRGEISKTHTRRQVVFHVTNYMGKTLWKETFSSVNRPNFQQISKLWCLPFLINRSIFPFQIFISRKARRSAVGLASVKLTRSFSMNHQVTLLIYVLFLSHVFHHFINWEWPPSGLRILMKEMFHFRNKWKSKWSSQLNKQLKRLNKNLKKFRLDQKINFRNKVTSKGCWMAPPQKLGLELDPSFLQLKLGI